MSLYHWEIRLDIKGFGFTDDETWRLLEGIVEAATIDHVEDKINPLRKLALDKNKWKIQDELNGIPNENELYVVVTNYRHLTVEDLLCETEGMFTELAQLNEEEQEEE